MDVADDDFDHVAQNDRQPKSRGKNLGYESVPVIAGMAAGLGLSRPEYPRKTDQSLYQWTQPGR